MQAGSAARLRNPANLILQKVPVIGIVSRFAAQKGFDLIAQIMDRLAREEMILVVLGSGDKPYEEMFQRLNKQFPNKIAVKVAYDNAIAHKIEAGADMFLMPSRYEPCGLNQIYSLKYGTVPIVRATGGLDDTIEPWDARTGKGTGFKFSDYTGEALLATVKQGACSPIAIHRARQARASAEAWQRTLVCATEWPRFFLGQHQPASTAKRLYEHFAARADEQEWSGLRRRTNGSALLCSAPKSQAPETEIPSRSRPRGGIGGRDSRGLRRGDRFCPLPCGPSFLASRLPSYIGRPEISRPSAKTRTTRSHRRWRG
jgi:glycogen synthase